MPLTFESDNQMRQFADQLYYSIITGGPEITAQFDKPDPFADSIAYLKGFADKEEKDIDGKPIGPAANLMNHMEYARALHSILKKAADHDTRSEERKALMEEAQVIMDKMSDDREDDPDMLCADFYRRYGYGKATDGKMKFISDSFHSIRNARCLMTARETRQEYETCEHEINEAKIQAAELIDSSKAYLKGMYKLGTGRGTFDTIRNAQESIVNGYRDSMKNLQSKEYVSGQRSAAKKELDDVDAKLSVFAEPLKKAEKQLSEVDDFLKTMKSEKYRKSFEAEEQRYSDAVDKLEEQDAYIANIQERIKNNELRVAQSQAYKDGLARIESEAPGIGKGLDDYRSWQRRNETLHNAMNTMTTLFTNQVNVNALLSKKGDFTEEEAEYLNQYDKAKNDIIENLSSSPDDAKKTAETFRNLEAGEEDILTAFVSRHHSTVASQISTLTERINDFEDEYGKRIEEYSDIKEQLEQNTTCEDFLKDAKKELTAAEKKRASMEADLKKCEAAREKRTKEVCKKLGFRNDENITISYNDAVKSAEMLHNKLEQQIQVIHNDDRYHVLSSQKIAAEKKVDDVSSKKITAKVNAMKKGLELEEKKLADFNAISQTRTDLKNKLQNLSDNQVEIQQKHKGLVHTTVQSKLQHNLLAIQNHLMDKSSKERIENRDKNSVEFNAMRDKLDEVFDKLSSQSGATKEEKTAAIIELSETAQRYYDAKMSQHVPNIFASEQRHARLECAKSLISLGKIAKSIENEVPSCEAGVTKFINSNVHVGVNKSFEQNFEKMLDEASDDLRKNEPETKIERHVIGEHMNAELAKLEPEKDAVKEI